MQISSLTKILISLLMLLILGLSFTSIPDDSAQKYCSQALNRALISFALARTLNGAISVAQETEIALQPAGVGVTFAPGQLLDPINDMVERFSWVMLLSSTSLGIQNVLLEMSEWVGFKYLLASIACVLLVTLWRSHSLHAVGQHWIFRMLIVSLVLRFSMPIMIIMNESIYQLFLHAKFVQSTQQVETTRKVIDQYNASSVDEQHEERGLFDSIQKLVGSGTSLFQIKSQLEVLERKIAQITLYLLDLMVVFLMQTVIMPLFFMWLLLRLSRAFYRIGEGWGVAKLNQNPNFRGG